MRKWLLAAGAVLAVCALPGLVILASLVARSNNPWFGKYSASASRAPGFELTSHDGRPLRLEDLRGNAVLLAFGFTRCPSICPATLGNLAAAIRQLPPEAARRTKVVFVSVDERDTPAELARYVPFFHPSFIGATGPPADIASTAKAYGASFRKAPAVGNDPADYTIDHSTTTTLIDPDGFLRMTFRFDQLPETASIANDITRILSLPPDSPTR